MADRAWHSASRKAPVDAGEAARRWQTGRRPDGADPCLASVISRQRFAGRRRRPRPMGPRSSTPPPSGSIPSCARASSCLSTNSTGSPRRLIASGTGTAPILSRISTVSATSGSGPISPRSERVPDPRRASWPFRGGKPGLVREPGGGGGPHGSQPAAYGRGCWLSSALQADSGPAHATSLDVLGVCGSVRVSRPRSHHRCSMRLTSMSENRQPRHRQLARPSMPQISLRERCAVPVRGMTVVRRSSSSKVRSSNVVVRTYFR